MLCELTAPLNYAMESLASTQHAQPSDVSPPVADEVNSEDQVHSEGSPTDCSEHQAEPEHQTEEDVKESDSSQARADVDDVADQNAKHQVGVPRRNDSTDHDVHQAGGRHQSMEDSAHSDESSALSDGASMTEHSPAISDFTASTSSGRSSANSCDQGTRIQATAAPNVQPCTHSKAQSESFQNSMQLKQNSSG